MTDPRRKRQDGVRSLADIRSRCVIDAETGCWIWRGAFSVKVGGHATPRVWLANERRAEIAGRAAWLLSGRKLKPGAVVWRSACTDTRCINPEHAKAGTRTQMHASFVADGRLRGDPKRAIANAKNCAKQLLPVETVRRAEAMFAAGVMQKDVRSEFGISSDTAARIRKGLHPNCAASQRVLPSASVFAWGARRAADERKAA